MDVCPFRLVEERMAACISGQLCVSTSRTRAAKAESDDLYTKGVPESHQKTLRGAFVHQHVGLFPIPTFAS